MKISPQTFFNFCAGHVPLLRTLMEATGEISEADVRRLIQANYVANDELPETTWRRLKELQILASAEPSSDFYFMADPVTRLLRYLFDEANAATPEIISGYIQSLDTLNKQLSHATEDEDLSGVRLALEELHQTLRRVQSDLDETYRCILTEVGRYKIERPGISVRDKFRRVVYWMERYVDPMVGIVRPEGPLCAAFDETERLLHRARELGLYNDLPGLERNTRLLRLTQRHALRVFQQCRRELQPLYDSLRRASFISEGAAIALESLQREGIDGWGGEQIVPVYWLRWQYVPSDFAIERAIRNISEYRPDSPPVLSLNAEETAPPTYLRRIWLEELPENVRPTLPVPDLLEWLVRRYPEKDTGDTLAGFTRLVFTQGFVARFTEGLLRVYETADGAIEAQPVELVQA